MGPPHRSSASPICPSPLHWRRRSLPTSHSVAASSPLCPAGADAGGRGGLPVGAAASGEASGHLVDMLSTLLTLWVSLLPMMWFIQRQMSAGGSAEKRRRSRKQGVGFGDVQGVDEAKEELVEGNEEIDNLRGIDLTQPEKKLRHDKHYRYVSSHDVAYWAHSFAQDLDRACKDHCRRRCWTTGFGLNFRVIVLSRGFRRLSLEHFASSYKKANRRLVFLDYDGTLVPQSVELISVLNNLCNDLKNSVFIVSGRGRTCLSEWFASCEKLGIAAEHGYFIRWNKAAEWETSSSGLE